MKKLIIFGTSEIAELASYYFSNDSNYEIVAFTVDDEFVNSSLFLGKPVHPFSSLFETFSPSEYEVFVALSYTKMNQLRKEKYFQVKQMGYFLASYVSSKASIMNEFKLGDNCFILEDNTIQPFVTIGNNVTLWSGNHIGHHSVISDNVFISSHVVISGGVHIEQSVFIGVNATIRDHITIGASTLIGAGAIIMKSTPEFSVYVADATKPREILSHQINKL